MAKFSIIIPVFNTEKYLPECLGSVLSQTFSDWEAICVDDGSTDASTRLLYQTARHDGRIKVFSKKNEGAGQARNFALTKVTGEWVVFLDSDDIINPEALSGISILINEYPATDMVHFNLMEFESKVEWHSKSRMVKVENSTVRLKARHLLTFFTQFAYSRRVLAESSFGKYVNGEDLLFMSECLCKAKIIVSTDECYYGYRNRAGSSVRGRWTWQRIVDELSYRLELMKLLVGSGKIVEGLFYKRMAQWITEGFSIALADICRSERKDILKVWYDRLQSFSHFTQFPGWYRIVIKLCGTCKLGIVRYCLCVVPYKAKVKIGKLIC